MMLLVEAETGWKPVDLGEEDPNMCVAVDTWWGMINTKERLG